MGFSRTKNWTSEPSSGSCWSCIEPKLPRSCWVHSGRSRKNTCCLVAQDLTLLTKVRTLIHEEISLLTVLYFPFRVVTRIR
jgi:hypothetical protein